MNCEAPFSEIEIQKATKSFQNNKSPGNDGLTPEFYKKFIHILKNDMKLLYEEIKTLGIMPGSMRQAVISCLYKKGKREDITNWRPISLLNYDYKIYAKCIANRMQPTLENIISDTQTAAIKGRTILENLQLNRDIIHYANYHDLNACMITLDQEKAFDRVDWDFLFRALQKFGYGENLIKHIKAMYNQIEAQIKANGHMSTCFLLERGVRQGCPLSMILYIIVAEVFIQNITQNKDIRGITVQDKEIKVSAFADDTTLYLETLESITALGHQLSVFEKYTGIKYNPKKCVGLWLGTNKNRPDTPLNFTWGSEKIKILGFVYTTDPKQSKIENWLSIKSKIEKDIKKWHNLKLSLLGKKLIINQVLLSKIWYYAYVENPPQDIINQLNFMIYNFLWSYKKTRINQVTTTMPIKAGGLAILHLTSQLKALKCSLLAKLSSDLYKNKAWVKLMLWNLDRFRNAEQGITVLKTYIPNAHKAKVPQAYRDILQAWGDFINNDRPAPTTLAQILNEPIFFNKNSLNLEKKSKYLFTTPPTWAKGNFTTLGDLCNENTPGFIGVRDFLEAHEPRRYIHNPKESDFFEIKKLFPKEWKEQILLTTAVEDTSIIVKYFTYSGKWKTADVETLTCKDFYRTIHERHIKPEYTNKKYLFWHSTEINNINWEFIFTNLYKNTQQKDAFDIQYRFLHLAQPTKLKLSEMTHQKLDQKCPRCERAAETQQHWLYYCPSSQNLFSYLLNLLETIYIEDAPFDNIIEQCLILPLMTKYHLMPALRDLFEIYHITVRQIRKDASYNIHYSEVRELKIFIENIAERMGYLFQKARFNNDEENFFKTWGLYINKQGKITLPQGTVISYKKGLKVNVRT